MLTFSQYRDVLSFPLCVVYDLHKVGSDVKKLVNAHQSFMVYGQTRIPV